MTWRQPIFAMTDPIVKEEAWLDALAGIPAWLPPRKPTLIIVPHPDDESLATGGLIAEQRRRNVEVRIVAVTDGGAAYSNANGLEARRKAEQENALMHLGVSERHITRLGLPDAALSEHEDELTERLRVIIERGWLVLAPWRHDWHPDHEACGRVTEAICKANGARLISWIFWTWHRKPIDSINPSLVRRFELDGELLALKEAAVSCHHSQLRHDGGEPVLPDLFLAPARRSFETYFVEDPA